MKKNVSREKPGLRSIVCQQRKWSHTAYNEFEPPHVPHSKCVVGRSMTNKVTKSDKIWQLPVTWWHDVDENNNHVHARIFHTACESLRQDLEIVEWIANQTEDCRVPIVDQFERFSHRGTDITHYLNTPVCIPSKTCIPVLAEARIRYALTGSALCGDGGAILQSRPLIPSRLQIPQRTARQA